MTSLRNAAHCAGVPQVVSAPSARTTSARDLSGGVRAAMYSTPSKIASYNGAPPPTSECRLFSKPNASAVLERKTGDSTGKNVTGR